VVNLPKVPRTPPADLVHEPGDILSVQPLLWRIHRTQGSHVLAWNQLRTFGPISIMRYDPQPEPAAPSIEGVLYTTTSLATALAETFQATRTVDSRSFGPQQHPLRPPSRASQISCHLSVQQTQSSPTTHGLQPASTTAVDATEHATRGEYLNGDLVLREARGHQSLHQTGDSAIEAWQVDPRPVGDRVPPPWPTWSSG
jgi:hypothetical protein